MKLIFIHYSVLLELFADNVCKVYLFYGRLIRLKKIDFFTKFSILKFSFLVFVYISYFSTKFITINLLPTLSLDNHPTLLVTSTASKVPRYGVISGPYFPVFGLNTGKYGPQTTPYLSTYF